MSGSYDTAQICPNGHVANDSLQNAPQHSRQYCERCGEKTLVACPSCNRPIRGDYHVEGLFEGGGSEYTPPAYCHACGAAFPWTDKAIQVAMQLSMEEAHLQGAEADEFKQAVENVVKQTPATSLGVSRLRKVMLKVGPWFSDLMKDTLKDVISETVKKSLWP